MKTDDALIRVERGEVDPRGAADAGADLAYHGYGNTPQKRFDVGRYVRAVRKHVWLIASCTLLITGLTTVFEAEQPEYYQATARIEINPEEYDLGLSRGKGTGGYDPLYFSSQLQIIEGPAVLRRVAKVTDLEHDRDFLNPFAENTSSMSEKVVRMFQPGGSRPRGERPVGGDQGPDFEAAFEATPDVTDQREIEKLAPYVSLLKAGLSVSPVKEKRLYIKETRLVDITFTHYDRRIAAKLANAVAETYVAMNLERSTSNNVSTGNFLQKRVSELQAQIRTGEERLINYARDHQIVSLDASQNTVVQRLADLNARLSAAENERIVAEAAYRAGEQPGAAAAQADTADARSASIEARMNDLAQRREQMLVELKEEAPEIVEIDRQTAVLQQQLDATRKQAVTTITTNLETKFREAAAREHDLRTAFEKQRDEVLSQNEASINYKILQQEVATNTSLLEGLLQRLRENDVVVRGTPNNVRIIDRALTPKRPAGPVRLQFVGLAFVLSLMLGGGFAILRERGDDTMTGVEEVETALYLPVVSAIPSASRPARGVPAIARPFLRRGEVRLSPDVRHDAAALEAYLHLRTSVLLATSGQVSSALVVSSGAQGEGKTTTAANLAMVLAETGAKVLLIDADLRKPTIGRAFGIEETQGLSTLLAEETITAEAIEGALYTDAASKLRVLPAGPPTASPATLLCSSRMRHLVTLLRTQFTYVIIDSPPALLFTDASVLSTLADAVLLVVRSGQSSKDVALRARNTLRDRGGNLFGVVLNDAPRSKAVYGYVVDREALNA